MPKGRYTAILFLMVCAVGACQSHKPPSSPPGVRTNAIPSRLTAYYPPGLSGEAQMEVFYVDQMGRCPDRYDYLSYACKAAVFAEKQTDPELKDFAKRKVEAYLQAWKSARTPPVHWKPEAIRALPKRLRDLLANAPDHSHKDEIEKAIQEVEAENGKGITTPSTPTK